MAHIIKQTSPIAPLEALAENLKTAVNTSWDKTTTFIIIGIENLTSTQKENNWVPWMDQIEISLNRNFEQPIRLVIRITTE